MNALRILLIVTLTAFVSPANAQEAVNARFRVGIKDSSSGAFFKQHPNIGHVSVRFIKDEATSLQMFKDKYEEGIKDTDRLESFEMTFEGHVYLLKKRYPEFILPKSANMSMKSMTGIKDMSTASIISRKSAILRGDSIFYDFDVNAYNNKVYDFLSLYNRSAFVGNLVQVKDKLSDIYKTFKPLNAQDSVVFIYGIVEENASLTNVKLDHSVPSPLHETLLEYFKNEVGPFRPRMRGGKRFMCDVVFFIKLNKDGSVSFDVW